MTAPFGEAQPNGQYAMFSIEDCYEVESFEHRRDMRAHIGRTVMALLEVGYAITETLVADGEEAKSRKKIPSFADCESWSQP